MVKIPTYESKQELFSYLRENKELLLTEKKLSLKHGDCFSLVQSSINQTSKAQDNKSDELTVKIVINSIGVMDSHDDVHVAGIWNKTVQERKNMLHLQEHKMTFENIISDNVKATVEQVSWKQLGVNAVGTTEVLMFESKISKKRNPFMFEQYKNGYVKNHSVGMQYVKIDLAVNDSEDKEGFALWEKYLPTIINKEIAEEKGYFFVVFEAKAIEGSAVPLGSNTITPTLEVKDIEPLKGTQTDEPLKGTHGQKSIIYEHFI